MHIVLLRPVSKSSVEKNRQHNCASFTKSISACEHKAYGYSTFIMFAKAKLIENVTNKNRNNRKLRG